MISFDLRKDIYCETYLALLYSDSPIILSRYVSLSSILAGLVFPIGVYLFSEILISTMIIFSVFVPVLLLATHQRNIERIFRGEENKVKIKLRKRSDD